MLKIILQLKKRNKSCWYMGHFD